MQAGNWLSWVKKLKVWDMGSACSCFRSKDPIEDNNGDNAINGDVGFTQNLYNNVCFSDFDYHFPKFVNSICNF